MYFLFLRPIFTWKHLFTKPFKWVIRGFSQSKFHHAASTFKNRRRNYIGEAKYPKYRHVPLKKWIEEESKFNKIYAHKVIKPFDEKELLEFEKGMLGRKFDLKGSIYAEAHNIPFINRLFKRDPDDIEPFCSEAKVELAERLGFINPVKNSNYYSPQELLELLIDIKVVNPESEIWK